MQKHAFHCYCCGKLNHIAKHCKFNNFSPRRTTATDNAHIVTKLTNEFQPIQYGSRDNSALRNGQSSENYRDDSEFRGAVFQNRNRYPKNVSKSASKTSAEHGNYFSKIDIAVLNVNGLLRLTNRFREDCEKLGISNTVNVFVENHL